MEGRISASMNSGEAAKMEVSRKPEENGEMLNDFAWNTAITKSKHFVPLTRRTDWYYRERTMDPLKTETEYFQTQIADWRQLHMGKFVLVKGAHAVGFYGSLEEAFTVGSERFGLEPFLVKQILPGDAVSVSLMGRRLKSA
jgi:hypothetical protein